MYLLYCDESGSVSDPAQKHFILAGICVYERQAYWLASKLDAIASRFNPASPESVELHGNHIIGGKRHWRGFPKELRINAVIDALKMFAPSHPTNRVFACVLNKTAVCPKDPVNWAFEQLSSRFDYFLNGLYRANDPQRGILIFDKAMYETTIQNPATDFRTIGHTWGVLRNLAEVPLFIDSRASRLIQLADLIAYALFRYFKHSDDRFYSYIVNKIDGHGSIRHGLYEKI